MRRERITGLVGLVAAVMVGFPAVAGAEPANSIYSDFATHGKLTRHYSRAELEAALKSALVEGYGSTAGTGLKPIVQRQLRHSNVLGAQKQLGATPATGALPFTGVDLGLIAVGGGSLLLIGGGLRRMARVE